MKSIHIALDGELSTEPDSYAVTVAQTDDNARLLRIESGEDEGRWTFYPDEERYGWAMEFSTETDARLMFGLWLRTGGFSTPQSPSQFIPVPVVREGNDACAAYLLVATGVKNSRRFVAEKLDISKQTVSNYANRVRWSK